MRQTMRCAGVLAVAAIALGLLGAVAVWLLIRSPRVSDFWPLDLAQPPGWLTDRQLVDIRHDAVLCRAVLRQPGIAAKPVADAAFKANCGWSNAVEATGFDGARLSPATMTCELASALALWITHAVQPKAMAMLGARVTSVDHLGSYACRNVRGSRAFADRPSQHATANALDITGFHLADGRTIRIAPDWGRGTVEARFLAEIRKEACPYFRVAIGPDYNAAHKDHFHLDRGPWRACR